MPTIMNCVAMFTLLAYTMTQDVSFGLEVGSTQMPFGPLKLQLV
jgi:hypothetical protein